MKKITSFNDKNTLNLIHAELNSALDKITQKYGLQSTQIGRITYSDSILKTKIELKVEGMMSFEDRVVEQALESAGLKLGDKVKGRGSSVLTITGYNSRASKSPVELKDEASGKSFKSPILYCKMYLIKN